MINLYYHGGSANHGCEAIVRSTAKILGEAAVLHTTDIESDKKYSLDDAVALESDVATPLKARSLSWLLAAVYRKLTGSDYMFIRLQRKEFFNKAKRGDVYLSIGGDNYCYAGRERLGFYNKALRKKGAATVLWGCSFEAADMDEATAEDIASYDLIISRESISYETLRAVNKNTYLCPDPAFQLDIVEKPLPCGFAEGNTVGINISPLIMSYEGDEGICAKNYERLIERILNDTDMNIALIPHVAEKGNDDREPLTSFYEKYSESGRIAMVEDCSAPELKGYISKCRFFVGARTHATIAAYSTCVPTLVVGYSVKSRGIARDLFGTEEGYVIPVWEICGEGDLAAAFDKIMAREGEIRAHLESIMPEYRERAYVGRDAVLKLMKK